MNPVADLHSPVLRQSGAATIAIVLVLLLILSAAIISMMKVSGSSVIDAAKNEEQVAALFLAESGMERAQAVVSKRAKAGTLSSADATDIVGPANPGLGRGSYQLTATFDPPGCGAAQCETVTIDSVGTIAGTATKRALRSIVSTKIVNNTNGCENTLSLTMPVLDKGQNAAVGALTHLAFRPAPTAGPCIAVSNANAEVLDCATTPGGTCDFTTNAWAVEGTGTNSVTSMASFATAPKTAATYSITTHLVKKNSTLAVNRSFVQLGVLFYPKSVDDPVAFIGRYANAGDTEKTTGFSGTVPAAWTCQPGNTTTAGEMWRAAAADLLYYGFASWPDLPTTPQLDQVTLGIQPLRQTSKATGTYEVSTGVIDGVYSQVWTSYNPSYFPSTANPQTAAAQVVTGATNGANFTGTIGSTFTGTITGTTNPRTLALTSAANLAPGSRITDSTGATVYGTLPASADPPGIWGQIGSTYTMNSTAEVSIAASLRAYDVMTVTAVPSSGVLTLGDTITNSGGGTTYGTLGAVSSGTWGALNSTYALTSVGSPFVSAVALESAGTTITVPGASITAPITLDKGITAVAVASGTGKFSSVSIAAGTIDAGSLTATGSTLCIGDALFGRQISANTKVTGLTTATSPGCGTGPFTVSGTTTASSDLVLARTAVTGVPTATSFTVSRKPTIRLSGGAVVCGGICAMLFDLNGTLGPVSGGGNPNFSVTLAGFPNGDDWASGFACLKNVDSAKIQLFGTIVAKQTKWAEVVR